ncbi:hypothetical protein GCM10022295_92460 [Streptomyces osmaniensis]|uniref:Uncharacterized protein n=1 Tax=Streptomyces osmaniensis TaxID=593134 RepID=A0ABP6Z3L4_9ACTN
MLAGRAGTRLADALATPVGRSTLLRQIRAVPEKALGVLSRRVVDAGDGWVAAECGVAAVVVVGVQEVCQGFGAFGVAGVGPLVGPSVEQGAVEAFDLPLVWGR